MVGIFSRFSVRSGHRRTQSALDEREVLPPRSEVTTGSTLASSASVAIHGIEIAVEFKPVEPPTEPLDNDQPIQCPLPEPSILNALSPSNFRRFADVSAHVAALLSHLKSLFYMPKVLPHGLPHQRAVRIRISRALGEDQARMGGYGRRECHQVYKGQLICRRLFRIKPQSKPRLSQENLALLAELFCHQSVPQNIIS